MSIQEITPKGYLAIGLIVLLTIGVMFLATLEPVLGGSISVILAVIASVAGRIFKPFGQDLEHFSQHNIKRYPAKCRILLIGLGRSGKTSIIKRFITVESPRQEELTKDFHVYEETKRIGLQNPHHYTVSIADYQGQKPSQIMINSPTDFFGSKGKRIINTVVFVVDPFPEITNAEGEPLEGEELTQALRHNAQKQIQERVDSQIEYVTKYTIELVFSAAFSKQHLFAVRLLINKVDLLREIVQRGYLPSVDITSMEEFIKKAYKRLIVNLERACEINGIDDFSIHLVSAHTGENIQEVLSDIVEEYHRRTLS